MLSAVWIPLSLDVMFGRGGDTSKFIVRKYLCFLYWLLKKLTKLWLTDYHIGNSKFRHLVEEYKEEYWDTSKRKPKSKIIDAILQKWRSMSPPGRFLTRTDPSKGDESLWHDVGDSVAAQKASQFDFSWFADDDLLFNSNKRWWCTSFTFELC